MYVLPHGHHTEPRGSPRAWLAVGHGLQMVSKCLSKPTLPSELAKHVPLGPPNALVGVWVALRAPVHVLPRGHRQGPPRGPAGAQDDPC